MQIRVLIISLIISLFPTAYLLAQEGGVSGTCNDGIDNDGDGFIDCYDKECVTADNCKDFFLNHDATCEVEPTKFPKFSVQQLWGSEKGSAANHSTVSVGDIKGNDGIPEIVVTNTEANTITLINGQNGSIIKSISSSKSLSWQDYSAIAVIDNPDCGYIFISGGNTIFAYDCNLNELWRSGSNGIDKTYGTASAISLADFNGDGVVELYYSNEIRDALTGEVLIKGSGKWANGVNMEIAAGSVAADVSDAHPGLELIVGLTIYAVDLNNKSISVIAEHPDYHPKGSFGGNQNHNFTSIADYDLDGSIDIIANGAKGNPKGDGAVYYWNVAKDELKIFVPPNKWKHGTGRVNVANIDDVPGLNCTFATGKKLYALDENFELKWEVPITEKSSGNTGTTVFDFNGDGKSEIVYRDEQFLYIIQDTLDNSGLPVGKIREFFPCRSRTGREYPVAADVNGDGQTEICVTCQHPSEPDINPRGTGHVRIFGSKGEKWIPARKLWNQHAYFNVNVNDNLTIPIQQQAHHISFSDFLCEGDEFGNPIPGEVYPLNSFLNQSPYLDLNGCPSYASPDVSFDVSPLEVTAPVCPETDFSISFFIKNSGDIPITNDLNISFYQGDPTQPGSIKLNTETVTLQKLLPTDITYINNMTVEGSGEDFDLFISLNDPPTIVECDPLNNTRATYVQPQPFQVYAEKTNDNLVCSGSSSANGSARAYAIEETAEVTLNYTFEWYKIEGGNKTLIYTGADYNFMTHGDYMVKASHDLLGCGSDSTFITIDSVGYWPDITIEEVHKMTNCVIPNGELKALVFENSVDVSDDYQFTWYEGTQVYVNQTFVGQLASGLSQKTYIVLAENVKNGCSSTKTATVAAEVKYPSVSIADITHVTSCENPLQGEMVAEASQEGVAGDPSAYTFTWYEGTMPVDVKEIFNESEERIDSLATGFYTVKATLDSTQCSSIAVNGEVLDNTVLPILSLAIINEKTSCNRPNGVLEANVAGDMNDYDIKWYRGNNTVLSLASPESSSGSYNETAENLDAITYTAQAVHKSTGCSATANETISENPLNITAILANITPQQSCIPADGGAEASASGGLSGDYSYYWYSSNPGSNPDTTTADYTGSSIADKATADFWLVAADKYEACQSDAVLFNIPPPPPLPTPSVVVRDYDSCDPAFPNGKITTSMPGDPNYVYQYYSGQVIHSSFALPGVSSPSASLDPSNPAILDKLEPQIYTVKITDTTTQCFDTTSMVVNKVIAPDFNVSASSKDVTFCAPPNGEAYANVAGNTEDYIFNWFIGTAVKSSPNYIGDSLEYINYGDHTVIAIQKDNKCKSDPLTIEVGYDPQMSIASITVDSVSSCINPNGALDATATGGTGGGFTYNWFQGEDIQPGFFIANNKQITNLRYGYYSVLINDNTSFCFIDSTIFLPSQQILPIADADSINLQSCNMPDGAVLATVANPGTEDPNTDYNYYWFEGEKSKIDSTLAIDPSQPANLLPDYTSQNWNGITSGKYTVIAEQKFADQCRSFPFTIEVLDDTAPPVISLSSEDNTHCAAPFSGKVMAEAFTPKGQPEPVTGYQYNWFRTTIDNLPLNPVDTHIADGFDTLYQQSHDWYTVLVTNLDTQCEDSATIEIKDISVIPYFTSHSKHDVLACNENGKILVTGMSQNAVTNYSYSWHRDDVANPAIAQGGIVVVTDSIVDITAGDYLVTATHTTTNCESLPLAVNIEDFRQYPAASLSILAEQISLNPGYQTGEVKADAIEQDGTIATYNFYWQLPNGSNQSENNQESDTLVGVPSGSYQVIAENVNTACQDTAVIALVTKPPFIEITDASAISQVICSTPDGELTVHEVTTEGTPTSLTAFDYYWYQDDYVNDISQNDYQSDGADPDGEKWFNRPAGEYYIVARDKQLWVESAPYQLPLEDNTHIPVIELTNRTPQVDCDPQGSNVNGELIVQVDMGAPLADYAIQWFEGEGTSGAQLPDNIFTAANLRSGKYTIEVVENSNGCSATATYFVPLEMPDVQLRASADANKNCANYNGRLNASLFDLNEDDYHFYWFEGDTIMNVNAYDYSGLNIDSLAPGQYSVLAVNRIAPSCTSEPQSIEVEDRAKLPVYEVVVEAPMTNCDTSIPNGQIRIRPEEQYVVEWFQQPNTTNPINTGYVGNHLQGNQDYLVRVSNIYNYCVSEQNVQAPLEPQFVPKPSLVTIGHLTNCATNNGFIEVDVDGNVINYFFEWNEGTTSHFIDQLSVNSYSVKAIDKFSGCESGLATFDILDQREYPEIAISTTAARCELNDGVAFFEVTNDTPIEYVTWTIDGIEFYEEVALFEVPPGDHQVTVESDLQCATSETFTLYGTIIVYNGISANGDGANDFMKLGCIENYGSNYVQIFNRSGMVVFEAENYDNITTFFDGHGNRGMYVGEKELPSGTYFYIIDLRDGNEPLRGFVELVRP